MERLRWGTWEELVLGGAIQRHGCRAWDAVALELQTRTLFPFLFTPQVCKDKYEDLLKCYSSISAWFEEIRKRRIDELRRALEKSEDSIGSLETKLETLKCNKEAISDADYSSSRSESPTLPKSEGNESSGREILKDDLSAGSDIEETATTLSPQCQIAIKASCEKTQRVPAVGEPSSRLEKFPSIKKLAETILSEHGVNIRRRRGKRRRKDFCKDVKEGSVGENNLVGATDSVQPVRLPDANDHKPSTSKPETEDITKILDSIMKNEHASVFQLRLDSQKRARYKKMIRQHMDLDTIKSRIANKHITSSIELLRDLLLLANNALVFYSKSTREYRCALMLRDLVTKKSQHHKPISTKTSSPTETPKSPIRKPPAKPRSVRPFNRKLGNKVLTEVVSSVVELKEHKQPPNSLGSPSSAESSVLTKKSSGRRGKIGRVKRGNAGIQAETPMKVRKRPRVK